MTDPNTLDLSHLDEATKAEMRRKLVHELWRRGNLSFKLDETQKKIRDALDASPELKFMLLCSRRLGKSFTLLCLAFEICLRRPGARVLYLAPQARDAKDIVTDLAAKILLDCPDDLKPEFKAQDREFVFKHPGASPAILRLKATNNEHAESLRGGDADLVILDECGQMDNLSHIVSSIVMPMLMTTGGRILLATTPPTTPGHDSAIIYEDLAGKGATVTYTIIDNPRVPIETKALFLKEAGEDPKDVIPILLGKMQPKTTTARREFYCEFVTDASMAVLPEFTKETAKEIVKVSKRPEYFDAYVSMDPGMQDRTGILFGYWDFARARLVIEDELLLSGPNTIKIAQEIKRKESELWPNKKPLLRVSDVDLRLIADLYTQHKLEFIPAVKQDSLGAINLVRTFIQGRTIEINPRCVNLVRQMLNAVWNRKITDFANAGQLSPDGHFDLVAAVKYMVRHVNTAKNPFPDGYGNLRGDGIFSSPRRRFTNDRKRMGLLDNTPSARRIARSKSK